MWVKGSALNFSISNRELDSRHIPEERVEMWLTVLFQPLIIV